MTFQQVVQEYERAVIFRLGRLLEGGSKGPGMSDLFHDHIGPHHLQKQMTSIVFDRKTHDVINFQTQCVRVANMKFI